MFIIIIIIITVCFFIIIFANIYRATGHKNAEVFFILCVCVCIYIYIYTHTYFCACKTVIQSWPMVKWHLVSDSQLRYWKDWILYFETSATHKYSYSVNLCKT